jgi:hypothetical protein
MLLLSASHAWAQAPANDDCAQATSAPITANCSRPLNGTVENATQSLAPTTNCGFPTTANDVWYSFVAGGSSQQLTLAPRFQAILDVRSGTCANSTSIFCTNVFTGNTAPTLVGGLTTGQTYFIRVYPSGPVPPAGISSTFALCLSAAPLAPANDDCAGAINVPVQAGGVCVSQVSADNTGASNSTGVPAPTCANYQGQDIWFQVTVPASGAVTVQTVPPTGGSPVGDTGMSVYSGTCGNLTQLGCDDDSSPFGAFSVLSLTGRTPGEVLYVRVWEYGGGVTGPIALCAVTFSTPANDNCAGAVAVPVTTACTTPVNGTVAAASQSLPPTTNCGFATGASDVWYSFVATGATQTIILTSTFQAIIDVRSGTCANSTSVSCSSGFGAQPRIIGGLTAGQTYFLRVYADGNIQPPPASASFSICINPGPVPPANDECATATPLPVTTACTTPLNGSVANASQSLPPTANCGFGTAANDVWYSFVASGPTQLLTMTSTFAAVIDVRSGTCANSTSLFCSTAFAGQGLVFGGLTAGQTYFIRIYPNGGGIPFNATFTLCLNPGPVPPTNDECAGAIPVPVTTACVTPVNGTVAVATQSLPSTVNCGASTTAADVWYSFVASGATQLISLNPRFGAIMDVRSGTCTNSTSILCTTLFPNPLNSTLVGGLTSGQTYFIRIYANNNFQPTPANATFTLCINPGPVPPANDECAGAVTVPVTTTCATPISSTVAGASQSLPPTATCGFANLAQDVWFRFVASGATQLITVNPTQFGAIMDVRSGSCASSTSIFCTTVFPNPINSTLVGGLTSGQTYFIRVYANGNVQPTPVNATFSICINPGPTPPVNDECATALTLPVNANCTPTTGTVAAASQSLPPTPGCGFGAGTADDVWYSFVATGTAQSITFTAPQLNMVMDVRSGTCANSTSIFCSATQGGRPTLVGGLTIGQTYFIRVYSTTGIPPIGTAASFTLCVTPAPAAPLNDDCIGALTVPVQFGNACVSQTSADNNGATGSTGVPAPLCASYQGGDLWFKVTVPASGVVSIRTVIPTVGTDVGDTGMAVYSGTCTSLTQLGCDDDGAGNLKSMLSFTGRTPGEELYVRVWDYGGNNIGTLAVCALSPTNCPAPSNPTVNNVTTNTAQLSWVPGGTPTTGTTYTVEYGLQGFTPGLGTVVSGILIPNFQLTNLQANTTYCYYVRQDCAGTSGTSALVGPECFTTGSMVCEPPTALSVNSITQTSAQLSWQQGGTPTAGTTYNVQYGPPGFMLGTGSRIMGLTTTNAQLLGLVANTSYCFYVQQVCPGSSGSTAYVGPSCFTTTTATACAAPSNLATSSLSTTSAQLSWQPGGTPAAGTTYSVIYGAPGFTPAAGTTVSGLTSPSYALTGLQVNANYCYYVRQDCPGTTGSSSLIGPACFRTQANPVAPANDEPCGAVTLPLITPGNPPQAVSSTNVGATTTTLPGITLPGCSPATTPQDVWFSLTPAAGSVSVTLNLTGSAAGMVRVFSAPSCSVGPFTLVACQSSGANNTGLSSMTLTNLTAGQRYYVVVSGYGSGDTPGSFTIAGVNTITASKAQAESRALLVYPNPSNTGQLTLRLSSSGQGQATLLNALGQVVVNKALTGGSTEQTLSTRGLATGVYTLRVQIGNDVLTRKVVLE